MINEELLNINPTILSKKEQERLLKQREKDIIKQEQELKKQQEKEQMNIRRLKREEDKQREKKEIDDRRTNREQQKREQQEKKEQDKQERKEQQELKLEERTRRTEHLHNEPLDDIKKGTNFKTTYTYGDFLKHTKMNELTFNELKQHFRENGHKVFGILLSGTHSIIKKETHTRHSLINNMSYWKPEWYLTNINGTTEKRVVEIMDMLIRTNHTVYEGMKFRPDYNGHFYDEHERHHIFNEWKGYRMNDPDFILNEDDLNMEYINNIKKHLHEVICNNDDKVFEYLLGWLSHIIQHPERKTEKGLFLYSEEEGTGKSHFVKWVGVDLLGKEYFDTTNETKEVLGVFNSILKNKILFSLDESKDNDFKGFKHDQDKLKNLITEELRIITEKGNDGVPTECFCNFILTSNNENGIECKNDTSRRVLGMLVNGKYTQRNGDYEDGEEEKHEQDLKNNEVRKYWYNIRNTNNPDRVFRPETTRHFFHYLRTKDLSNFDIRNSPNTKLRRDLINKNIKPIDTFLKSLKKGYFNGSIDSLKNPNYENITTKNNGLKYDITHGISTSSFYHTIYRNEMKTQGISDKFILGQDKLKSLMVKQGFQLVNYRTPKIMSSTTNKLISNKLDLWIVNIEENEDDEEDEEDEEEERKIENENDLDEIPIE